MNCIGHIKKIIIRTVKGIGSLLPQGQKGAVDSAILYSLFLTLLALANNGFDIKGYPALGAKLQTKCSNFDQLTDPSADPAAVKACADTMIQVAATGMADTDPENFMTGLLILGAVDAGHESLSWNKYSIEFKSIPANPLPNAPIFISIQIYRENEPIKDTVTILITGTNGYAPIKYSDNTHDGGGLSLDIPGAPAGTLLTITVTAVPGSLHTVTKTFTVTVSKPTYSGPFKVEGTVKRWSIWHDTKYTCSCTLTQSGTATVTMESTVRADNKHYSGLVEIPGGTTGTLSACSTTPSTSPDGQKIDACYPDNSGKAWPYDAWWGWIPEGPAPDKVTWTANFRGGLGRCIPITAFSGTVNATSINGTVSMISDPLDTFCSAEGKASSFELLLKQ